mgnify:FL=1
MDTNAKRYLELISQHLQEHHAALFVGSGFSLNADKVTSDVPDIPLWAGLAQKFKEKLGDSDQNDPLALAESVEIAYGRSELDHLLLDSIKDADYRPSPLYEKLLRLPWSDVFTTNYDTLLERAGENLVEKTFTLVTNKNDLVGSSGATRLIKLHGSFPSQRPFIITAEDYRTYPQKFAPFVNTVQQSLLENTLCMIGFSGNDPNFNNWIGWIRDNLGAENAPYLYLLSHESVSDVRREWLHRRNIIVVDLSEIFSAETPYAIYEKALDYLWNAYSEFRVTGQNWKIEQLLGENLNHTASIKEALPILKKNHENCPKAVTLSALNREQLKHLLSITRSILAEQCSQKNPDTEKEIEYLYEYDWLNEKALLPLFSADIDLYQKILDRNSDVCSAEKGSILLSMLRSFREHGDEENWNKRYEEIITIRSFLTDEQQEKLQWEKCLHLLFRYEFQQTKQQLREWRVSPDKTLWALRKAALCAELGEYNTALSLLQNSLSNLRQRLSRQTRPDAFLISLESPMMRLQSYISQAYSSSKEEIDGENDSQDFADEHRRTIHRQYEVDWEDENKYFTSRLEAHWVPFQTYETKPGFDFGISSSTMHLGGEDEERILAFSFLRFREETGIPFRLGNVVEGTKAAGGAAERIALYCPLWAILTVVRTDEEKYVESSLTRGVLSTWPQEDADECCKFYMDAVLRTETELNEIKTHWANTFATRTARILLTALSELCSKCSDKMMETLLVFLKKLYESPQKEHYLNATLMVRRLISFYPVALRHDLVMQLLTFPLPDLKRLNVQLDFPDPFEVLSASASGYESNSDRSYKEVEQLIALIQRNDEDLSALNRLLYCGAHGLLTTEQKKWLGGFIWENGEPHLPPYWLDTVCLKLPSQYEVEEVRYLCQSITNKIAQNTSGAIRFPGGDAVFTELINVSLPHADDFTPEETSAILEYSNKRITALSENINREVDIFGDKGMFVSQIYQILHALWIFTTLRSQWTPTEKDCAVMSAIITQCDSHHISHHGIKRYWSIFLKQNFESKKDLEHSLRSADTKRAHSCYNVLATTICNPDKRLLPDDELCIGLEVAAQQIAWGVPKQLVSALQTVSHAVQYRSDLLTMQSLELILTGLSQLVEQTRISSDDTVKSASDKGSIRKWAVILATKIDAGKISKDGQEILKDWRAVSQDKDEFAEIRNGQR